MNKIKSLIKYELLDLKRSPLFWVMGILYIFGIQQVIGNMTSRGGSYLTLIGFQKDSWLPLNLLMIPILFIGIKIGKNENDIFKSMDISFKEFLVSKLLIISLINFIIFFISIVIFTVISLLSKVSLQYFIRNSIFYITNTIILLLMCSSLGLFIGSFISKHVGDVISYILAVGSFVLLSNFYKEPIGLFPLINCNVLTSVFYVNTYEKSYLYHNVFWALMAVNFIVLIVIKGVWKKKTLKILSVAVFSISILICAYCFSNVISVKTTYYDIYSKRDAGFYNKKNSISTFFSNDDCGYYVDKYSMDISIDNKINNVCNMQVVINKDNVNLLEFGLYNKLNISEIQVNGKKTDFKRTINSFIVEFPKAYKSGDIVDVEVAYQGEVNTIWDQSIKMFYVSDNRVFLGDVFEWYPKLNDSLQKTYDMKIKYDGKNKIYSNLDGTSQEKNYKFSGKDKEILLISGDLQEVKYKDITIIGNEEYVNNSEYCDIMINRMEKELGGKGDKIILGTFIPGGKKMKENYEKVYYYGGD